MTNVTDHYATAREFMDSVVSFRDYMGDKRWTPEQIRNGFKMVGLNYLRLREPPEVMERMADIFHATTQEYLMRQRLSACAPA